MDYVVWPLRNSTEPVAMIDFYRALGLRPTAGATSTSAAGYAGRSGGVGVGDSGATPSPTTLQFRVGDIAAAVAELTGHGLEVRSPQEQLAGRRATLDSPSGLRISLEEARPDGGAELPEQTVAASMDVVAICTVPDVEAEADFFARLGFRGVEAWQGYLRLNAAPGAGLIALRGAAEQEPAPEIGVEIGVETSEPFDALAGRLHADGYAATIVEDEYGTCIRVVDPDGRPFEIRPTR